MCTEGNYFAFIKDNKGLPESLEEQKVAPDETSVFFYISSLFSAIPVPVLLEVINRKCTEHMNQKGTENFLENSCLISKDKSYLPFGTSTQQLSPFLPGKIPPTT